MAFSVGVSRTPSDPSAQSGYEPPNPGLRPCNWGTGRPFHIPQHWTGCLILCAYLNLFLLHDWFHLFCAGQSDSGYEQRYREGAKQMHDTKMGLGSWSFGPELPSGH